ncbi:MAG: DUF3301 domain-containing protein [Rhodanobacter sp.]
MSDLSNLLLLVVLLALVGLWLKLSVARERAVQEARRQCVQHDLQLLDETVGLRGLRLRRVNGLTRIEHCYGFDVSIDGHDRELGRLWMIGDALSSVSLPTVELLPPVAPTRSAGVVLPAIRDNVVPLRPPPNQRLH